MRRMISETLMQKIKRLFKSVWSDDEGNVEVGKNLEVDGNLILNSPQNIKNNNRKNLLPIFQHTVTIAGEQTAEDNYSGYLTFTANSTKNTPIDSYQDLHELFGGCNVSVSGLTNANPNAPAVLLNLHGGTIATDFIEFVDISAGNFTLSLSKIGSISFADDVCLPK